MQDAFFVDALNQAFSAAERDSATPTTSPTFTGPVQNEESMPTLTDEIKTFIVKGLACFDTPSEVAEAVQATFGIEVSRQHVYSYDPGCTQPPALRWRALHAHTRRTFLDDVSAIGIANRTARLRILDQMLHRVVARHNTSLAAMLLEQAAKECGGMYKRQRYHLPDALGEEDITDGEGGDRQAWPAEPSH
jgi:hypothetical protein